MGWCSGLVPLGRRKDVRGFAISVQNCSPQPVRAPLSLHLVDLQQYSSTSALFRSALFLFRFESFRFCFVWRRFVFVSFRVVFVSFRFRFAFFSCNVVLFLLDSPLHSSALAAGLITPPSPPQTRSPRRSFSYQTFAIKTSSRRSPSLAARYQQTS